jgi:hypothetical protein
MINITAEQMLQIGLEIVGFEAKGSDKTQHRRYTEEYGGDPDSHAAMFRDLQTFDLGDAKINKICAFYFFMTLYYVRSYGIETRVMGVFGLKCTKTFSHHVWMYLRAFQALKALKVCKAQYCINFCFVLTF